LTVIILVAVAAGLSSCSKETSFPADSQAQRLLSEKGKWPHDYYGQIENDIVARIKEIRVIGDSQGQSLKMVGDLLDQVKADWPDIAKLETADQLVDYLHDQGLAPIAEAIQQSLTTYRSLEPAGEFHIEKQITAIRHALIAAHREVQNELSGSGSN
jgi:hypothetical protein